MIGTESGRIRGILATGSTTASPCCYYHRQDQILRDGDAVRRGVINAVNWIKASGFTNVVVEIANQFGHSGFDHRLLKNPEGVAELIRLAKRTAPDLLVSASGYGDGPSPSGSLAPAISS